MNGRYFSIFLTLAVLVAGCSAPITATTSGGASDVDSTDISVAGTGQVSAGADRALVFVSVTARTDTAEEARAAVAADATRMRSALRAAGVPDDGVTTQSFRITPRYDGNERERRLIGYTATHAFRLEVGPDVAGEVIDVAVGNGGDVVDGVRFTLRDETRAEVRTAALENAVDVARQDAGTIAAAAGISIRGVAEVSTSGGSTPVFDARFDEAGGGGGTTLEPGPVTVTATVSITYRAE